MRKTTAAFMVLAVLSTPGFAQDPVKPGIVYRLTDAEKEAVFAKLDQHRLVNEQVNEYARQRPNRVTRIGTGILGFLGANAAESAYEKRCGSGGVACIGNEGRYVNSTDVLRR